MSEKEYGPLCFFPPHQDELLVLGIYIVRGYRGMSTGGTRLLSNGVILPMQLRIIYKSIVELYWYMACARTNMMQTAPYSEQHASSTLVGDISAGLFFYC